MRRINVLLIVMLVLAGCAPSSTTPTPTFPPPPSAETQTTLPEPTDPTQLITVKAGETFDLVVPSNPSTGHHWDILPESDPDLVELVAQNYFVEQPVVPGSGGMEAWTFRAVNVGETTIALGYYPPGNATEPEEMVVFSIAVE